MNLICNRCGNKEREPYDVGDNCYFACGGFFVELVSAVEEGPILCKMDDSFHNDGQGEKDPSGKDQHEPGAKLDNGKVKAGVLENFSLALWEVARVGSNGSVKYTRRGWETVPNGTERYSDAKWRHLLKGVRKPLDPEWNILHLAHEAWNCLAKLELTLRKLEE